MERRWRGSVSVAVISLLLCAYAFVATALWQQRGAFILEEDCDIDFGLYYTQDALRIEEGMLPEDAYRGPLYPMLLALFHAMGAGFMRAGMLITVGSALFALVMAFLISRRAAGSDLLGLTTAVVLALCPPFLKYSLLFGTDMFFAALLLCAAWLLLARGGALRDAAAGLCMGIALDTRWNALGIAAIMAALVLVFPFRNEPFRRRFFRCLPFLSGFLAGCAPVMAINFARGLGPFDNSSWILIGYAFYHRELGMDFHDYCALLPFKSVGEIIRYRGTAAFISRWARFFGEYIRLYGARLTPPIGILAGLSLASVRARSFRASFLPLFILASLALHSFCPYSDRFILSLFPLGLCAAAGASGAILGRTRGRGAHAAAVAAISAAYVIAAAGYAAADATMARNLFAERHRLCPFRPRYPQTSRGFATGTPEGFEVLARFTASDIAGRWTPSGNAKIVKARPDSVRIRCSAPDPGLLSPPLRVPVEGDVRFMVRMRAGKARRRTARDRVRRLLGFKEWLKMQVFWAAPGQDLDESRSTFFYVLPGREERVHVVNVLEPGMAPDTVTRLRFDQADAPRQYEIAEMALLRARRGGQAPPRDQGGRGDNAQGDVGGERSFPEPPIITQKEMYDAIPTRRPVQQGPKVPLGAGRGSV
jgi:hypothetical protein